MYSQIMFDKNHDKKVENHVNMTNDFHLCLLYL